MPSCFGARWPGIMRRVAEPATGCWPRKEWYSRGKADLTASSGTTRAWLAGPGSRGRILGWNRRRCRSWHCVIWAFSGTRGVSAGVVVILDRALERGGWNCGNRSVFGTELRPQPAPTGLALLALAAKGERAKAVGPAVAYLHATLGGLRAAVSVGWAVLGLRAQNALPLEAENWLEEAHARCSGKPDAALGLALLLLASSEPA